jgi:hypothetical protein
MSLKNEIKHRTDAAVLASNHSSRLAEIEGRNPVTHRSSKRWVTAEAGVNSHGRLPIYYRQEGMVTHKGYITDIILDPSENEERAEEFVQNITEADTYSCYNDKLDTTTFVVSEGKRISEFNQSELKKLSGDGNIAKEYSRQPAYVVQRPGDFE